ncbi:MAG: hypothetical protein GF346_10115 [Candidatus Eisenbacteria bacterium]|nr:hypothetical protein [Candidatus Latescibacterota bacterium]MBD3302789.1 hypothetical protein [Candidatus Eisenbacteria bacterium]
MRPIRSTHSVPPFGALARLLAAVVWLAGPGCAPSDERVEPPPAPERVTVRAVSEQAGWTPGAVQTIGLLFAVEPDWHLYGNLRSDSGLPLEIHPEPPPGFVVEEIAWPAPERLVSPGGILDHVYEEETLLMLRVKVPEELVVGRVVAFPCSVAWLVCGTGCIPGSARPVLELPVLPSGAPTSEDAALFRQARERVPAPIEETAAAIRIETGPETAILEVPGAAGLTFLPSESCVPLEDPIADAVSETDRLRLRYAPGIAPPVRIAGILEIRRPAGRSYVSIGLPPTGRKEEATEPVTGGSP